MDKQLSTMGLYAGITSETSGKLLLFKREESKSLFGKDYSGKWELPGGALMPNEKVSYSELNSQLKMRVKEKLDIDIDIDEAARWGTLTIKTHYGVDVAVLTCLSANVTPKKGDYAWISPRELEGLVQNGDLVGGYGKRQHKMALMAFSESCNPKYKLEAVRALKKL